LALAEDLISSRAIFKAEVVSHERTEYWHVDTTIVRLLDGSRDNNLGDRDPFGFSISHRTGIGFSKILRCYTGMFSEMRREIALIAKTESVCNK